MGRFNAALVLACSLGLAGPAVADEDIARRLGALKALVSPAEARRAVADARRDAAEAKGPAGCEGGAWWRLTGYGVQARIETAVRDASLRFAIDPALLHAVIRHESNYQVRAVSHKGAEGLMQLMPATARELGVVCSFDPRENVLGGARYLRQMRDRLGSWPRALAAYHAGPRAVERGRIPGETRRYVKRIVATWRPEQLAWIELE
ncbi:MAG: lytic transglycosylase domain-containing protein [Myxococcota bacterium]|nr:lytic transglycosylase domain-containing protein [Myxococcota bacterium]